MDVIDYEFIKQKNKETAKKYASWLSQIEPQAKEDNKKKTKKKFLKWILILSGVVLGFIVVCALMF